jgi:TonB family protein
MMTRLIRTWQITGARRAAYRRMRLAAVGLVGGTLSFAMLACGKKDGGKTAFESASARPDVLPTMTNKDLPFRYPPALYAEKVQGNVMLRLYVDTAGVVVNDSTKIVESSNVAMLDSAAVRGSRELQFVPAKLRGVPMAVSILFPVYFRHPEAAPPPSDTMLNKVPLPESVSADTTSERSPNGPS